MSVVDISLFFAADAEDALGKNAVSPGALMPAREQLGALLIAHRTASREKDSAGMADIQLTHPR
jgi:hypothetical protein